MKDIQEYYMKVLKDAENEGMEKIRGWEILVPGYEKNEIEISVIPGQDYWGKFNTLKVIANNEVRGETYFVRGIPNYLDENSCKAELKNGILNVEFQVKKAEDKTIKVEIK